MRDERLERGEETPTHGEWRRKQEGVSMVSMAKKYTTSKHKQVPTADARYKLEQTSHIVYCYFLDILH